MLKVTVHEENMLLGGSAKSGSNGCLLTKVTRESNDFYPGVVLVGRKQC